MISLIPVLFMFDVTAVIIKLTVAFLWDLTTLPFRIVGHLMAK